MRFSNGALATDGSCRTGLYVSVEHVTSIKVTAYRTLPT
jgi:hypothetical protein